MQKITLFLLLFLASICVKAQSYMGFLTDNYSGVNSVISNPANITDSRFKTDINLIGASVFAGNDYYGVNVFDAVKSDYDFDLEATKSPSTNNNFGFNADVMGPSFMFNINKESSIAVFSRARSFININNLNGETADLLDNDTTNSFIIDEGDFNAFAQAWAEIGVTYARVFLNEKEHFVKAGLSLKYLKGFGSGSLSSNDLTVNYDENGTDLGGGVTTGSVTTTGDLTLSRFEDIDDDYDYDVPDASGFGVDFGVVYEWRPDYANYTKKNNKGEAYSLKDKNKYKLKLGLSVTDLGSIKYEDGIEDTYSLIGTDINENDFDDIEDIENIDDVLNNIYTQTTSLGYNTKLPTAVHVNADWSFNTKFYLNLNTDFSLISKSKINASRISNAVSLTPRFESKWFSFYLPLNVVQHNDFQAGAGLRAGPLYIGSGSVISVLASDNVKGADVYAGIKIPVYQGSPKDKDGDGILDKLDGCPEVSGPIENNGCPWEDKDNDGLLDNVDKCPEEAGPKENNGCPWGDKDGDTVLDNVDKCVNAPGPVENNGCPWTDSDRDGVLDKDDKCIDVPGTVANNGCPEIVEPTAEVQKTLNTYAKTILFNSGKSSIKAESNQVLKEIVKILGEYPTAKFLIEGHTDSAGSDTLNQGLSDSRANAVKKYLIDNGVDQFRLSAIGYGESKPIASNATKAGRAENRRVEINLVK